MEENFEQAFSEQLPPPSPGEWIKIWFQAVTSPNITTYQDIARQADVKTAYLWLGLLYLIPGVLMLGCFGVSMLGAGGDADLLDQFAGFGAGLLGFVVGFTIPVILVFALYSGLTALSNVIAKSFGGVGDFRQLIYCVIAQTVPITLVQWVLSLFSWIPCVNILVILISLGVLIYAIVINVIAIKAVHKIETWQAIVSSGMIYLFGLSIVACFVIVFLTMMDPAIGNVFSNVIEGLEATPGY